MNYAIIIRPLIGAVIGYATNWIAVKMMFRPLNPIMIGKYKLPFTPGIIPKNRERIATSIGNSISKDLLTEDAIKETLLSDEIKLKIKERIENYLDSNNSSKKMEEIITEIINKEDYSKIKVSLENKLTDTIFKNIKEAEIGNLIVTEIEKYAKDGMKNSILGIFGGNSLISNISQIASVKINEYIDNNGQKLIFKMVSKEVEKFEQKELAEVINDLNESNVDLSDIILKVYEEIIINKLNDILNTLNISKIITNKINSMELIEVERMILEIMKKELNALVNLGAVIGFLLGLLNLLF